MQDRKINYKVVCMKIKDAGTSACQDIYVLTPLGKISHTLGNTLFRDLIARYHHLCYSDDWWPAMLLFKFKRHVEMCANSFRTEWVGVWSFCSWLVRLGDVDLNNDNDDHTVVMRMIGNITIHPQYKSGSSNFDVAVLKLNQSVAFSTGISPVCLPNSPIDDDIDQHAGRLVRLIGWSPIGLFETWRRMENNTYDCNSKFLYLQFLNSWTTVIAFMS